MRTMSSYAAALLALFGLVLSACSDSNDRSGDMVSEDISVRSLPWVSVENLRLVDAIGREVSVRGINARVEGLFDVSFDDGRIPLEPIPAFTREDAA